MSRIVIDEGRCKGCALCTHVCPFDLVRIAEHFNAKGYQPAEFVDPRQQCTACANCATMCPDLAITVYRTPKPMSAHTHKKTKPQALNTTLSSQ
jgi:2-oxoglutarate ferredoxin oxidoreductase subunit delta